MDGDTASTRSEFQTADRILIPRLVKSRDGWKKKANQRKKLHKAATIRIRDLVNSRSKWKDQCQSVQDEILELKSQLDQAQRDLAAARAEIASL